MHAVPTVPTPRPLPVVAGHLPKDLRCTYYKNGPARTAPPSQHLFDSPGFITKVYIDGPNNYASYQASFHTGSRNGNAFSGPAFMPLRNLANTSIHTVGENSLAAFYDGGPPLVLDPVTLKHKGALHPYSKYNNVNAHPKETTEGLVIADLSFTLSGTTITFSSPKGSKGVNVPGLLYIHDWAVTPTYYIFFHHPLGMDPRGVFTHGIAGSLCQDSTSPSRVCLVPRGVPSTPLWFDLPIDEHGTVFVSHVLSAKEYVGSVIVDCICYRSYLDLSNRAVAKRFILHVGSTHTPLSYTLLHRWCEFPRETSTGFVSTCEVAGHHPMEGILEYSDGIDRVIYDGRGCLVGEPIPCPSGHILFMTHDVYTSITRLVILSKTIERSIECVMEFPTPVPMGLHGCIVDTPCGNT